MDNIVIREITANDNTAVAVIIRGVFEELDAPKIGTAYADPQLDRLSTVYGEGRAVYFVADINGRVVAGAGIAPLENGSESICELQKMYASAEGRGKGIGSKLMQKCLDAARAFGFTQCYLETLPYMEDAQRLYQKFGFSYLEAPLGATGHSSCPVWMLKDLTSIDNITQGYTIKQYKQHFTSVLTPLYDVAEADRFFYTALEEFAGWKRMDFIMKGDTLLTDSEAGKWQNVLQQLADYRPIQYIFNKAYFYGLEFKVNQFTLIPRPETEELVEWIIHENKARGNIKILDIGTGSGCIAIALAINLPNAHVYAIDISAEALAVAKENAQSNNAAVTFINKDILKADGLDEHFDIIVSNPPYVRNLEKAEIKPNVLEHEPHLALFVDDNDPLIFYRKIAELAKQNLGKGGKLYFEINQYLGAETVKMLEQAGFINVVLRTDLFGNNRMIACSV